jgi:LemA protein
MKRKTLYIIIGVIVLVVLWAVSGYNGLVSKDEVVKTAWSQVENQYQRRFELIPNLVSTVQGYADFEKSTITGVTEMRSRVGQVNITADDLSNPEKFAAFQQAQDGLSSALSRLLAVVENYPNLKANENFLSLQSQLEGTENRIAVERGRYNETVMAFNIMVRRFPKNILAGVFGFDMKQQFKSVEGSDTAPKVQFDTK